MGISPFFTLRCSLALLLFSLAGFGSVAHGADDLARVISLNEVPAQRLGDEPLKRFMSESRLKPLPFPPGETALRDRLTSFLAKLLLPQDGKADIYFLITNDTAPNSSITLLENGKRVVTLSSGFLQYFKTDSEMALVLGHELEHLHSTLNDIHSDRRRYQTLKGLSAKIDNERAAEFEVDVMSLIRRVLKNGYSPFAGFHLFDRLHEDFGMQLSNTHPLHLSRREISGFAASLAIRGGGIEAADRLGVESARGSLIGAIQKRVFETPEFAQARDRVVGAILADPQSEVDLVARRIRAQGDAKGFDSFYTSEFKKNWELIRAHYGTMDPAVEHRLYSGLAASLEKKYQAAFERHFPPGYRVRSAEEFVAIHNHLLERWNTPLNFVTLEDQERRLSNLARELESAKSALMTQKMDEWQRREAEYLKAALEEDLALAKERALAMRAHPIPVRDWRTVTPVGAAFRLENRHVLAMASGDHDQATSLLNLANRYSSDELTPELRKLLTVEIRNHLEALRAQATAPGNTVEARVRALEDFRDVLYPRLDAGSTIRPTLVDRLLEKSNPEERAQLVGMLKSHFDAVIAGCASPSECISAIQLFDRKVVGHGQSGSAQVQQAKLMQESGLVLPSRSDLADKAKSLLATQTLDGYGFAAFQKLLDQLTWLKPERGDRVAVLSAPEAQRVLQAYAASLRRELAGKVSPLQMPSQAELEAYLLVRDNERFRSLRGFAWRGTGNPLEEVLPLTALRERLTSLAKRRTFLTVVSQAKFDGLKPFHEGQKKISVDTTRFARRSTANGLPTLEMLDQFFYDSADPEKFYRWANTMPDLVNWTGRSSNSNSVHLESFLSQQIVQAEEPFLFRESAYGNRLTEDAAERFREQYFSGKMSLASIHDRSRKLADLYQRPALMDFFFQDLGKILLNFKSSLSQTEAESAARQIPSALARAAEELEGLAKRQGLTMTEFLEKGGFKSVELPQAVLSELSRTGWIEKASASELSRVVPALLALCGPKTELDQVYGAAWKKISSTEPALLEKFMDPRLVRRLRYDFHITQLAGAQLDHHFGLSAAYRENRRIGNAPEKSKVRPVLAKIEDFLGQQFPEKSPVCNQVLDFVTQSLVATPEEVRLLGARRFDLEALKRTPQLSRIDLLGAVEKLASSPQERYGMMEWVLGLREDLPELRKYRKNEDLIADKTGLRHIPEEYRQALEVARRSFREGVHPLGQTFAMQVFLDHRRGVLADSLARERLYDLILGEYGENPILRKVFVRYTEALPIAEQKTFLSHLLIRKSQAGTRGVALREVFEAMGPLGAKIAQFLRTLGVLPKKYRDEFDQFFDNFFKPNRDRAVEYLKRSFGEGLGPVSRVGDIKGSGSLTFILEAEIKTPSAPQGKTVALRFLKDEASGQIRNESQVLDRLIQGLGQDSDTDVRKVSDYLKHIKATVMTSLDPVSGTELHLRHEVANSKRAAAVYDRATSRATGFRVEANRVDQEVLAMLPPELLDHVVPYESIDFTPWNEVPTSLREKLAGQVLGSELDALFEKGEFDPDAHPGNWLVDLKGKRLVRVDYSQMTRFKSPQDRELFVRLVKLLAQPSPSDSQIRTLSEEIPRLFELSHPIADLELRLKKLFNGGRLPGNDVPHERLFFLQEELLKAYKERGIQDGVVKLAPDIQNALGSLSRMSQFAREMAQPSLFSRLLIEKMGVPLPLRILQRMTQSDSPVLQRCREWYGHLVRTGSR